MVNERPKIPPLGTYNLSQTAKILGQSRDTIRKAATLLELHSSFNRKGQRFFTGASILKYYDLYRKPI